MALNYHDQRIVDLYHEGSTQEPPAALDAAVLSAARAALAEPSPQRRKTGWWKRFSTPMQFAASFVLVALLSVLVTREADVPKIPNRDEAAIVVPAAALAVPQAESVALPPAKRADATEPVKAAPPQRKTNDIRPDSAKVIPLQSSAPASVLESVKPQASGGLSPPLAARAPAPRALAKSEQVDEARASAAKESAVPTKSIQGWLDEITALLDQGKIVEARRLAEAFQKEHPNEVLSDDLKKRLAP